MEIRDVFSRISIDILSNIYNGIFSVKSEHFLAVNCLRKKLQNRYLTGS